MGRWLDWTLRLLDVSLFELELLEFSSKLENVVKTFSCAANVCKVGLVFARSVHAALAFFVAV